MFISILKIIIHNYKLIAKLTVMHIVVTNLCIWFLTIVIETEEQYLHYYMNKNSTDRSLKAGPMITKPTNSSDKCKYQDKINSLELSK